VLYYSYAGLVQPAASPFYLSVGRRELIEKTNDAENNLGVFGTYWVTVSNLTGLVSTAENAGIADDPSDPVPAPVNLNRSRRFVRKALSVGGR
jgi:hypothetical protein